MAKKILILGVALMMCLGLFAGCNGSIDKKPTDLGEVMPEIWENGYFFEQGNGDIAHMDLSGLTEITIGIDDPYWELWNAENLENIYVVEEHPTLVSDGGVLYSKSGETLIRWPAKKPVTKPKSTIKYFARECYAQCINFSEDFELPDGTISIGGGAFFESTLTKIHVKQNVKTVGHGAFRAETFKTIEVSSPVAYRTFFNSCYVEKIVFNNGVKQIRASNNHGRRIDIMLCLKSVEFPDTLEAIGDVYFPVNIAVKKYTLNDGVQYLSEFAFDTNAQFGADWYRNSDERARKEKTVFEYSNKKVVKKYFEKKLPIWNNEWEDFLDRIKISIQNYKEQGSPYADLENYLEALQSK